MSYLLRSILAISLASFPAVAQTSSSDGSADAGSSVNRHSDGQGKQPDDAIARERNNLPLPVLMESIQSALGEKSLTPLSADQSRQLSALNADFERQVRDFIRTHADGKGADVAIPDRAKLERQVLDLLNKDQRAAAEQALRDTADKRITEHNKHSESHSDKRSGGDSRSNWQTSSSSQSSSESHSQRSSSSQSRRDNKSDSHSERKSDSKSDSQSDHKTDNKSDGKSGQSSDRSSGKHSDKSRSSERIAWSKLDAQQKKAVIHDLLQQLPAKDREALAKELGLNHSR